jgi:hypothetical protein
MRGRGRFVSSLSILLLLASASAVQAAGKGWLEKLSGPGPFFGWEYPTLPLWCFGEEASGPFCKGYQDQPNRTVVLSFTYSDYDSRANSLEYEESNSADKTVNLKSFAFSLDLRLHPALDVGVGLGVNRFSGDAFNSFSRFSLDGLRVTWRPIGLFHGKESVRVFGSGVKFSLRDLLQVKLRATLFPGGFDAGDFGSTDTFDEPSDLLLGYSFSFGAVFWW